MWRSVMRVSLVPSLAIFLLWLLWLACGPLTTLAQVATNSTDATQNGQADHKIFATIIVTKTVSTLPSPCAMTKAITVAAGTQLYYCYSVQNTGNITLATHTIKDS